MPHRPQKEGKHNYLATHTGSDGDSVPRRILIVEDEELAARQLQNLLTADPTLQVEVTNDAHKALADMEKNHYSVVITDLYMPGMNGMQLIKHVQQSGWPVTVIVTTGQGGVEEAVQAIRMGAYDFLTKPIDIDNLRLVIQRALRECALRDEVARLRNQLQSQYSFHNILS